MVQALVLAEQVLWLAQVSLEVPEEAVVVRLPVSLRTCSAALPLHSPSYTLYKSLKTQEA
jgi:hypothetical protein